MSASPDRAPVGKSEERLPLALRSVVLPYAIVSSLWILVSDRVFTAVFRDPDALVTAMTLKGWAFVAVTSVLLVLLLGRYARAVAQREATLGESERAKLRALLLLEAVADSSPDAIVAKDNDGRYVLFNKGAETLTGKTAKEVLGRTDEEVFPPEIYGESLRHERQVRATNAVSTYEQTLPDARGELTLLVTKGPLRDSAGALRGLFGIARDISARKSVEDKLRESEMRFATFFRSSPIGIGISRFDGPFVEVNDAFLSIVGYERDEVIGRTSLELGLWPDLDERARMVVELAEHRRVRNYEAKCRRKNGEIVRLLISGELLELDGRQHFMGMLTDIAGLHDADAEQRRDTEEAIRASKQLLQCVIDSTPDWIHAKDRDYRFLLVNQSFAQAIGETPEGMVGRTDVDFLARDLGGDVDAQIARIRQLDAAVLRGETVHEGREEVVLADGELRVFDLFKGPLRDAAGAVYAVLTVRRDVTERRRKEQEQHVLEERARRRRWRSSAT